MTTIVNNPVPSQDNGEGKGAGFLIAIIFLIVFAAVALYFAIPALKGTDPLQINVAAPQVNVPAPQVNVQVPEATPSN